MKRANDTKKGVEGGTGVPQSWLNVEDRGKYIKRVKFYTFPMPWREGESTTDRYYNDIFPKAKNLKALLGKETANLRPGEQISSDEMVLLDLKRYFEFYKEQWYATKEMKTWSKNSREFDAVSRALDGCMAPLMEFDKVLSEDPKETNSTDLLVREAALRVAALYSKLLPLIVECDAYIDKNDSFFVWRTVGRVRLVIAENIRDKAEEAKEILGGDFFKSFFNGTLGSQMDANISGMKSNSYGDSLVTSMWYMNEYLEKMNTIPGKGNYIQIKQKLGDLISRYNEREIKPSDISVDIFYLAKELEELCYAYTRRYGNPTTTNLDNHLTLVSNIAMYSIMLQKQLIKASDRQKSEASETTLPNLDNKVVDQSEMDRVKKDIEKSEITENNEDKSTEKDPQRSISSEIKSPTLEDQSISEDKRYKKIQKHQKILLKYHDRWNVKDSNISELYQKIISGDIAIDVAEKTLKFEYIKVLWNLGLDYKGSEELTNLQDNYSEYDLETLWKLLGSFEISKDEVCKEFKGLYGMIKRALKQEISDDDTEAGIYNTICYSIDNDYSDDEYEGSQELTPEIISKFEKLYNLCLEKESVIHDDERWPESIPLEVILIVSDRENDKVADKCIEMLVPKIKIVESE